MPSQVKQILHMEPHKHNKLVSLPLISNLRYLEDYTKLQRLTWNVAQLYNMYEVKDSNTNTTTPRKDLCYLLYGLKCS